VRKWTVILAFVVAVLGALALGRMSASGSTAPVAVRTPLAAGMPSWVKGYQLSLFRVTIPAHYKLAPHRHPGMTTAYISSGRIDYTVYRGKVVVSRGAADGTQTTVRTIGPGQTGAIPAGDWIVEYPGTWHSASNPTGKQAVVLQSTLLIAKQPVAIPVTP
jgi:quercetin dioxygenase-like cupin family protein